MKENTALKTQKGFAPESTVISQIWMSSVAC
jgi:hypothetical protein